MSLAVALAAGALIGAERQQAHEARRVADFGGIRTFPLLALLGAISALLQRELGPWAVGAALVAVVVLLAVSHARSKEEAGITSEVAGLITFALGVVAATPEFLQYPSRFLLVAAIAATTMALLALKQPLHGFAAKISSADVYATVKFVLLALVVIPVLPNQTFGPLQALNPFKIGVMITLVAGVSFAGYVAARAIGSRRGLLVTGLIGGLVSSTAVTLTFSGRAKEPAAPVPLFAIAVLAACSTMFARILVIVGIADARLLASLTWPVATMAVTGYALSFMLLRRESRRSSGDEQVPFRNPFELRKAVAFGLLYAAVLFIAKAAQQYAGASGLYVSAVLAGLTDVDAITLTMTELHRSGLESAIATNAIALAAITNTIVKTAMAYFIGGKDLGRRVGVPLSIALGLGGAVLVVQALLSH